MKLREQVTLPTVFSSGFDIIRFMDNPHLERIKWWAIHETHSQKFPLPEYRCQFTSFSFEFNDPKAILPADD